MPLNAPRQPSPRATWDVFCSVVDNHGDAGVCWRLAADLASRGIAVRLWIDDARSLAWMAPEGRPGVEVRAWPVTDEAFAIAKSEPAAVVMDTFGCGLPDPCLRQMGLAHQRSAAPVWINLEYLSAEPYVERNHRLPSPQGSGPARGLTRWYFYPGFTTRTGGLLREPELMQRQATFNRESWLADQGIAPRPGERMVSLFCYANPHLPELLRALAAHPTLLLTTPGHATEQVAQALASSSPMHALRVHPLPWLTQIDYDALLWCCDLNLVRGEDSLVRAIWAGRPFLWQIYPQHDGAHATKLAAFLARASQSADRPLAQAIRLAAWRWNSLPATKDCDAWGPLNSASSMSAWQSLCTTWRTELMAQPDLATQLMAFAEDKCRLAQAKI
ncbi:MAG: elongation factor P maturation arginine rhamnosyltransferase EarP [Burkholderiales bacterium]